MAEKWSPNDFIEESLKRMSPEHIVLTNEPGNFVIESTFPSAPLSAITEEVRLTLSGRQTDLLVNKIKELMLLVVVELGRETGYIRKRRERIVQLRGHESKSDPNAVKSIVYDNLKHLLSPDQIERMISTGQLSDHEDDIFEVHSRGIIDELMYIKRTSYYVKIQEMAPEMTPEMVIRPDVQTIDTVNRVVIISYDRLSELIRAVRMVTEDE